MPKTVLVFSQLKNPDVRIFHLTSFEGISLLLVVALPVSVLLFLSLHPLLLRERAAFIDFIVILVLSIFFSPVSPSSSPSCKGLECFCLLLRSVPESLERTERRQKRRRIQFPCFRFSRFSTKKIESQYFKFKFQCC